MPIVHVTPLGSNGSDASSAVAQIIDYLQRGTKQQQPSPNVGYYADSAEGPGVWRGRGVGGHQLAGPVDPELLREVLLGHHPATGQVLVTATGSAGRASKDRPTANVATSGPPDELLTTAQVATLLTTSERYIRKIAIDPTSTEQGADVAIPRRARLQGTQIDGNWVFKREDVERFARTREEPKVVVAYDVTLSVEKSISLAWVHADQPQRQTIDKAIDLGVTAAISYLEDHAIAVRRGRGSESVDGVWAASYRHLTNRNLEPQLHEHILIANVGAPTRGGQTQAIDARGLMHHAKTAGYVAGAVIRNHLSNQLGIEWDPAEQGLADIAGIKRDVIDAMSTRRKEVMSLANELGLDSLTSRQYAALTTRQGKQQPADWDEIEATWQQQLSALGFTKTDWLQLVDANRQQIAPLTDTDEHKLMKFLDSAEGVTQRSGIFTRRDVVQRLVDFDATHGSNRLTLDNIEHLTDKFLTSHSVVQVDVPSAQRARTGEARWYTTTATLQLERNVIDAYRQGCNATTPAVHTDAIDIAINQWQHATGHTLGDDQAAMVRDICTTRDRYAIVVGPAGTGKTAAVEVAARAWEESGWKLLGVSVTGAATDQLAASTGIETRTVASLLQSLDNGNQPLHARTILIVDEASTLSNRDHHALLHAVKQASARMVTIGDPAQHTSVDAGGLWAHLVTELDDRVAHLDTNRRQTAEQLTQVRLANADYRGGRIAAALQRLTNDDRVTTATSATELLDELAADWYIDRQRQQSTGGPVSRMMAEQHTVRRQLNERAQALLLADGTITGPGVRIGDSTFHIGDDVVTRTRDNALRFDDDTRLRNGAHGKVIAISEDEQSRPTLTVDFVNRGPLVLDHNFLTQQVRPGVTGGLTPAYAVTTHIAQGSTYGAGRMIASDTSSRAGVYVGLTRGTTDARLYAVRRRELDPAERSDVGLPAIIDTRTASDALADQLAKPEPASIVAAVDTDASRVQQLASMRLTELRTLSNTDPAAHRAIDLIAARVVAKALETPSDDIVQRFGKRPAARSAQRPVWDYAVTELVTYQSRYGTDQLSAEATRPQTWEYYTMTKAMDRAEQQHQTSTEVKRLAFDLAAARTSLPIDTAGVARATRGLQRHIEAAVAEPAGYLTTAIGKKPGPDEPQRVKTWEAAAKGIETWRHEHGITPADGANLEAKTPVGRALYRTDSSLTESWRLKTIDVSVAEHLESVQVRQQRSLQR
jgi:conjugative relaxase-like TrwC/TraI family protein